MTRAVVFDLDGTLIDSLPDIAAAANALLDEEGLEPLPQSRIGGFVGMGEKVFLDRLIAATGLERAQYDALMARFMVLYKANTGRTRLFPGVLDMMSTLRDSGLALGLCTNKPGGPLQGVLDALDLGRWFDAIIAGDTLPIRKPDPAPLHLGFERMGATEGVYVGDSDVDAETAQRAGIPFLLFSEGIRTKPVSDIPHDALFGDFSRLPDLCTRHIRRF